MAKLTTPKMRLPAGKKFGARASLAAGFIRQILADRRKKFTDTFSDTFVLFEKNVKIDPELLKYNPRSGEPFWCQDVRNAAKCTKTYPNPAIQSGSLCALVDGGFCLPGHVPAGRVIDPPEIPIKGLEPPRKKVRRYSDDSDDDREEPSPTELINALIVVTNALPYKMKRRLYVRLRRECDDVEE